DQSPEHQGGENRDRPRGRQLRMSPRPFSSPLPDRGVRGVPQWQMVQLPVDVLPQLLGRLIPVTRVWGQTLADDRGGGRADGRVPVPWRGRKLFAVGEGGRRALPQRTLADRVRVAAGE